MIYDSAYSGPRPQHSVQYRFDPQGNEISALDFRNDTLVSKTEFAYGVDGPKTVYTDLEWKLRRVDSTMRLADGRYKTLVGAFRGGPAVHILSFLSGGKEVIVNTYQDTLMRGEPYVSNHIYYSGDTLLRSIEESRTGKIDRRYYYSQSVLPDSMVRLDNRSGKVVVGQRLLNSINDRGDVSRRVDIYGQDTAEIDSFRYQYDRYGNWTRLDFLQEMVAPKVRTQQAIVFTREYVY